MAERKRVRSLTAILLVLFALLLLLVLFAFIATFDWGHSAGGTLPSGRSVMFYSDSWRLTTGQQSDDTWMAKVGGRTIVVGPTAVTVDGREFAKLEPAAKNVSVTLRAGRISAEADGITVGETP